MANEKRLIDATPLIDECVECMNIEWNKSVYTTWAEAEEDFRDRLLDAPTVDAVEVKHGRWKNNKDDYPECDKCGYMPQYDPMIDDIWYSPYCPNCGADMRGDGNA